MSDNYAKQYYQNNKDTILPRIREHQKNKYDNNIEYKLMKRYQSRIDNHFGTKSYKAEDLLHCSPEFFVNWIIWCKKDLYKAKESWEDIEIGHVRPVSSYDKDDLTGWIWMNTLPQSKDENLKQGNDRDIVQEKRHLNRVLRYLRTCAIDTCVNAEGEGIDLQSLLTKLPFTTTGIPGEMHLPKCNWAGPGTSLDGHDGRTARLNPDDTPKDWSRPINQVDAACYVHDLDYRDAGDNLPLKHEADRKLLSALDRVQPNTFGERIMKKIVELAMKTKLKLGLGLSGLAALALMIF